jgi:hypothetical protein
VSLIFNYLKVEINNNFKNFTENPNRKLSTCPICGMIVKPGSMTFHKKTQHGYVPKSRKRFSYIVPKNSVKNSEDKENEAPAGTRKSRRIQVYKAPINKPENNNEEDPESSEAEDLIPE